MSSVQASEPSRRHSTVIPAIDALVAARRPAKRLSVVIGHVMAAEFAIVAASTFVGSAIYHYSSIGGLSYPKEYIGAALYIAVLFTIVSLGFRHFDMARKRQLHVLLWSGIGGIIFAFAIFLSTVFLLKISSTYSRGAFVFEIICVCFSVCIFRALSFAWLQSAVARGFVEARHVVLVGNADSSMLNELRAEGMRVADVFPFPRIAENKDIGDGVIFPLGADANVRTMMDRCRTILPDDVLIFAGQQDLVLASNLAHRFSELPCNVHIAPRNEVSFLTRSLIASWGSVKTLQLSKRPLSLGDLFIKRTFDIVVATGALIALSPLLFIVALAIKLDSSGKVLFRQMRHGYNNKVIRVFKFRTMRVTESGDDVFCATTPYDLRVTTVGKILRRTSIDELPQLLNVLLGEMSIVGPRPHATAHNQMFDDQILPFARRHNVKPGITGWAQVNGYRGPANTVEMMRKRVEYDLFYIDNWSLFLDLKILLMTLFSKQVYANAF